MFHGLVVAALLIGVSSDRFMFPVEQCKEEVREARERLKTVVQELATEESENRLARLWNHLEKFGAINTDHSEEINEDCGERTPTLFPPMVFSKDGIEIPSIFGKTSEDDAYVQYMHMLHANLLDENKICNVNFQGLNSINEEQLYGAVTLFATNHASPICPICTYVVRLAVDTLVKNLDKLSEDIRHLIEAALKIMPPAETLCGGMIPICKDAYKNGTEYNSTECFKCSFCMTGSTLLQHNFLQDQKRVDGFGRMFEKLILDDFCTELCYAYPPGNSSKDSMFPDGISKQECIDKSELAYKTTIDIARHVLLPNNVCPVIGVCPPNATPNVLHCLHEYCIENQKKFSFLAVVCDMIPDHPEEADEYLNIASQKKKLRAATENRDEL